jgi:hypothetical protein
MDKFVNAPTGEDEETRYNRSQEWREERHNQQCYGGKSHFELVDDLVIQTQLQAQYEGQRGRAQWAFTNIKRERLGLPPIEWIYSSYNPDWVGVYQHEAEAVCETR